MAFDLVVSQMAVVDEGAGVRDEEVDVAVHVECQDDDDRRYRASSVHCHFVIHSNRN